MNPHAGWTKDGACVRCGTRDSSHPCLAKPRPLVPNELGRLRRTCDVCGAPLAQPKGRGRSRRYCERRECQLEGIRRSKAAIAQHVEAHGVTLCPPVPSVEQPREVEERGRRVLVPFVDAFGRSCLGEGYQTPKRRGR